MLFCKYTLDDKGPNKRCIIKCIEAGIVVPSSRGKFSQVLTFFLIIIDCIVEMTNHSNSSHDPEHELLNTLLREDFQLPNSYVVGLSGLFLWTFLNTVIVVKAEISLTEGGSTTALQYIQISVCNTAAAALTLTANILNITDVPCTVVLIFEQLFNVVHLASVLQVVILSVQRLLCYQFPIWSNTWYKSRWLRFATFSVYVFALVIEVVGFIEIKNVELEKREYCFGSEFSFAFFKHSLAVVQYWLRFGAGRVLPCVILLPVTILLTVVVFRNYRQRIKLRSVTACESFLNDSVVIFIASTTLFIETLYIIILNLDNVDTKTKATSIRNIYRHLITDAILLLTYTWYFFYHTILGTKERKYVHKWRKETFSSFTRSSRYLTVRKKQKKTRQSEISVAPESSRAGVQSVVSMNQESSASGVLEREL